jgi:DNA helicase HerA-like ATPase
MIFFYYTIKPIAKRQTLAGSQPANGGRRRWKGSSSILTTTGKIYVACAAGREICLEPALANRHGLVAGATGTGKTITLQTLVEGFSALGTPVFLTDVKGDLAGLSQPGEPKSKLAARAVELGLKNYCQHAFPVCFWDLFGQQGHPLRVAVSSLGPMLLARMLDLNEVQSGVLHIIFRIADDQGLLLLDLKDLRSMTAYVAENAKSFKSQYGTFSPASIGAIQRGFFAHG